MLRVCNSNNNELTASVTSSSVFIPTGACLGDEGVLSFSREEGMESDRLSIICDPCSGSISIATIKLKDTATRKGCVNTGNLKISLYSA